MKKTLLGYVWLTILMVVAVGVLWLWVRGNTSLQVGGSKVTASRTRVERLQEIGEWEFLTISEEELVDTTAVVNHLWPLPDGKKQLVRIYSGTLRLGFDLQNDVAPGWASEHGDSIDVTLPAIRLLDERFVDEAATRALIEEGRWTYREREKLTDKARRQMRRRCFSPQNIRRAEQNAVSQVELTLRALGYRHVNVHFAPQ